jgi:hypothetical protein
MDNHSNLLISKGTRFGKLIILELTNKRNKSGNRIYRVKCDCGNICEKTSSCLKKKKDPVRHCGTKCSLMDRTKKKKKHGHSRTHEYFLWKGCQNRAKKNNIPFNLEYSDIVIPEKCPILEIPIFRGNKKHTSNSPSLDRLVPELGYIKGNIRVISYKANTMKSDASIEELKLFSKNIITYFNEAK